MFKKKYYLNLDKLIYERASYSLNRRIRSTSFKFLILIVLASVLRTEYDKVAESPKMLHLIKKNNHLKHSYKLLNNDINKAENLLTEIQQHDDYLYHAILNIPPIPSSIRDAGVGGSENISDYLQNRSSEFVVSTATRLEKLANRVKIQSGSLEDVAPKAFQQLKILSVKPSINPLAPSDKIYLSSNFGMRWDPFTNIRRMHQGIDIAGSIGMKVYATGDGKVVESVSGKYGYGKEVVINHGYGYKTRYAHLHKIMVKPGENVKRGQLIGLLGNTGRSTGPHLHYEVIHNNKPQNPLYFFYENLTKEEYSKIISLAGK